MESGNTLDEQIVLDEKRSKFQRHIETLEKQAWNEKQPKRKFELAEEIQHLKTIYSGKEVQFMDLEMLGIAALEASLAKTDQLQSFLSKRDKEPIWDGPIHIHKGKKHQKAGDKKVYVQVKCKSCCYTTPNAVLGVYDICCFQILTFA
jgi:hypothetical protein